jgi:hypothetical protein
MVMTMEKIQAYAFYPNSKKIAIRGTEKKGERLKVRRKEGEAAIRNA